MNKFTIYLGLNDKDTKLQKYDIIEAYKIVTNFLSKKVDGATIYHAQGVYYHTNGDPVIETTLRIELIDVERRDVQEIVSNLKVLFNQESVLLQTENVNCRFV